MHEISINIENIDVLTKFLNFVIDCEVSGEFNETTIKSWKNYGFSHEDEINLARKSLSNIFAQFSKGQIDQRTLKSFFPYLGPELQERIVAVLESRREEIVRHLLFVKISSDQKAMETFDWDVKWILGSSSSSTFHKLITCLTLNCRKGTSSAEGLHLEMDREHLDQFIEVVEECERQIAQQ